MSEESKVLVVTGASQGLGEGFVKAYRDHGRRVVGNLRSIKPSSDPDFITVPGDIGEPAIAGSNSPREMPTPENGILIQKINRN